MTNSIDLSEREIEILKLVATGVGNKEIARKLSISTNTVKVHLRNIFTKIGVLSRTEATLFAIEHHIVDSPAPPAISTAIPQTFFEKNRLPLLVAGVIIIIGIILFMTLPRSQLDSLTEPTTIPIQRLQELIPLPEGRTGMASAVYENQIYVFSGETSNGLTSESLRYDLKINEWQPISDKPTPVRDSQATLLGEKIYIPGGLSGDQLTSQLEVYDPRSDSWEEKAPIPRPCAGYALATLDGKLYLFGGWDGQDYLDQVYIYDPATDAWLQGANMPTPRAYAKVGVAGGKIYVIGGSNNNGELSVNETYTPNRDRADDQPWMAQSSLPDNQAAYGMQSIGDVLFVVGKSTTGQYSILQFLPQNDEWTYFDEISNTPLGQQFAIAAHQGNLYMIGGLDGIGELSDKMTRYQVIYTVYIPVLNK
jgi:DNA-binding CsgD family transcriptional regulator/N-acetylneuraminic acid mutarotase